MMQVVVGRGSEAGSNGHGACMRQGQDEWGQ